MTNGAGLRRNGEINENNNDNNNNNNNPISNVRNTRQETEELQELGTSTKQIEIPAMRADGSPRGINVYSILFDSILF